MKLIYKRRTSKLITGRLKSLLCLFRLACRCVTPCVRFPSLAVRLPLYSKNPKRFFGFGFLCVLWVSPLGSALYRPPYLAGVCSASKNLITIDAISALVVPFFGFIFSMPLSLLPDMYPLSIPNLIGSCA